jgi:hypothetical protein
MSRFVNSSPVPFGDEAEFFEKVELLRENEQRHGGQQVSRKPVSLARHHPQTRPERQPERRDK